MAESVVARREADEAEALLDQLLGDDLASATGSAAEVDHSLSASEDPELFVDLEKLVC